MKKGNRYPHARARWVEGWYPGQMYNPPCWCRPYEMGAIFIDEFGGIPIPVTVFANECGAAQWEYLPDEGGILWHGIWAGGIYTGEWFYEQYIDNVRQSYNRFGLMRMVDGIPTWIINDSEGRDVSGEWTGSFPHDTGCTHNVRTDAPWFSLTVGTLNYLTYQEVRDWGADANDTAPRSWTSSPLP